MSNVSICHISTVHPPRDNRIFYKQCLSLKKAGYDVHLLVCDSSNSIDQGIRITALNKQFSRIKRIFCLSLFIAPIRALKINARIYHFHDIELIPMGLVLKLFGKKVIYDIHENMMGSLQTKPYLHPMIAKAISYLAHFVETFAIRFFDAIVCARPDISKLFNHQINRVIKNVPKLHSVDNSTAVQTKKDKLAVIYVGGMSEIRGTKQLIDSFAELNNLELWLLGSFENETYLQKCKSSPGWNNVKYLGIVKPDDVFGYIKSADIGIITFLPAPNHLTTLATKPFEYMSCGIPMIMSNFEYWKEFFKDLSFYVDPSDPVDISNKIQLLANNEELRHEMGKKARNWIFNEYNWEKEEQKLVQLYKELEAKNIEN